MNGIEEFGNYDYILTLINEDNPKYNLTIKDANRDIINVENSETIVVKESVTIEGTNYNANKETMVILGELQKKIINDAIAKLETDDYDDVFSDLDLTDSITIEFYADVKTGVCLKTDLLIGEMPISVILVNNTTKIIYNNNENSLSLIYKNTEKEVNMSV